MVSWGEFARFSPREGISRDSATDSKPVSGRAKDAQTKAFIAVLCKLRFWCRAGGVPERGTGNISPASPAQPRRSSSSSSRAFIQQRPERIPCLPLCLELTGKAGKAERDAHPVPHSGCDGQRSEGG